MFNSGNARGEGTWVYRVQATGGGKVSSSAGFSAKDAESGLSTAATGSFTQDTSRYGYQTVTVTARDKVGHVTTKSCTYRVS